MTLSRPSRVLRPALVLAAVLVALPAPAGAHAAQSRADVGRVLRAAHAVERYYASYGTERPIPPPLVPALTRPARPRPDVARPRHTGPSWDAGDGSRIVGTAQASAVAPRPDSIPWLLLQTHSVGGSGRFAAVTSVQRIETAGGTAPDAGCTPARIGRTVRVPYAAVYAMYSKGTSTSTAGAGREQSVR